MTTQNYSIINPEDKTKKIIHIHSDPNELNSVFNPDLCFSSSSNDFSDAIADIKWFENPIWKSWRNKLRNEFEEDIKPVEGIKKNNLGKIFSFVEKHLPEDVIVTLDAGNNRHTMDTLSEIHLGHKPISFKEIVGSGKKQLNFSDVNLNEATKYAAEDAAFVQGVIFKSNESGAPFSTADASPLHFNQKWLPSSDKPMERSSVVTGTTAPEPVNSPVPGQSGCCPSMDTILASFIR